MGEGEDTHLGDFIEDKRPRIPRGVTSLNLLKDKIRGSAGALDDRERRVLERASAWDGNPRTLEEVGQQFNVTRERIRQIEAKALRKMRHPTRSKKLKSFVEG